MRKEAQEHLEKMLSDLRGTGNAVSEATNSTGASGSSVIRKKLQNAVSLMQEGLVERDTEVRCSFLHDFGVHCVLSVV